MWRKLSQAHFDHFYSLEIDLSVPTKEVTPPVIHHIPPRFIEVTGNEEILLH